MSLETLLTQSLSQHSVVVLGIAFIAGVVSSILPCTLSMMPLLVGYIGGYTAKSKWAVLLQILMFITGLALVMGVLGVAASLIGVAFGALVGSAWYYAIGILAILMGLQLLNIIQIPMPQTVKQFPETAPGKLLAPLLLGVTFGITASPCGTPFLAAILGFISHEKNILLGGLSLVSYALGQGTLLLFIGLFTGILKHIANLRHVGSVVTKLSALLFFVSGALLILAGANLLLPLMASLHLI